jgi:membrane associated rhomboid family serine protease
MLPVILLNLGIGFVGRGFIDNAAHMGGLLSGAALAAIVGYKRPGQSTGVTLAWRVGQVLALLIVAISFFFVARDFDITF